MGFGGHSPSKPLQGDLRTDYEPLQHTSGNIVFTPTFIYLNKSIEDSYINFLVSSLFSHFK